MTSLRRVLPACLLAAAVGSALVATPAHAGLTIPVQCEIGAETLLPWDDVTYDLQGTCGAVRLTADDATVTMPAATHLVVEGSGSTITAKPLLAVEVTGADNHLVAPSIQTLALGGSGSAVEVSGLVEDATLAGTGTSLTADVVNMLRMRGANSATARKSYRTRITGSDNVVGLRRADRLVVLGDLNGVRVERGRTTVRDKGADNVLDLRPRRHR